METIQIPDFISSFVVLAGLLWLVGRNMETPKQRRKRQHDETTLR